MHRKANQTRLILIGSITIITGSIWIGSELYFRFKTDPITPDIREYVVPLAPQLQSRALDQLEQKTSISIDFQPSQVQFSPTKDLEISTLDENENFSPFQEPNTNTPE